MRAFLRLRRSTATSVRKILRQIPKFGLTPFPRSGTLHPRRSNKRETTSASDTEPGSPTGSRGQVEPQGAQQLRRRVSRDRPGADCSKGYRSAQVPGEPVWSGYESGDRVHGHGRWSNSVRPHKPSNSLSHGLQKCMRAGYCTQRELKAQSPPGRVPGDNQAAPRCEGEHMRHT